MGRELEAPGAAHLVLADGVVHLDPEQAVFQAMLAGWERQQRTRFLNDATIGPRLVLVRRMAAFTNSYPWQWEPADAEDFITHLRSAGRKRPIVVSTARGYELSITLFMQYVTDPRYGWPAECANRFGRVPQQVFHDGNSVVHVADFEGQPGRRPLTYDEVQALFDAADSRAEKVRGGGRKGCADRVAGLGGVTHLIEFDYPERFVSEQVGHRYASTTAIYTNVSDEYRTRLIRRALESRAELWEGTR